MAPGPLRSFPRNAKNTVKTAYFGIFRCWHATRKDAANIGELPNLEEPIMTGSKKTSWAVISAALIVLGLAEAHAGGVNRQTCFKSGSAGARGRQMGERNGSRIVDALWARLGRSCDQLERLAQIVSETPLSRPMMSGEFAACFYQGYVDSLYDRVGDAYDRCQVKCFGEGLDIGRISAEGYCAASIAVGGLYDPGFIEQPPLPFCGESLVFGCKAQYVSTATQEIAACRAYTRGSFAETFDNSVRQDCFVPSDVPVIDGLFLF
jgi:hypothetical protein